MFIHKILLFLIKHLLNFIIIARYLQNRKVLKEKNEKEIQKKLAIRHELGLDDPACPPGHILLPKLERLDHLAKIQKGRS